MTAERKKELKDLAKAMAREARQKVRDIRRMRDLGASDHEIALALGITEYEASVTT